MRFCWFYFSCSRGSGIDSPFVSLSRKQVSSLITLRTPNMYIRLSFRRPTSRGARSPPIRGHTLLNQSNIPLYAVGKAYVARRYTMLRSTVEPKVPKTHADVAHNHSVGSEGKGRIQECPLHLSSSRESKTSSFPFRSPLVQPRRMTLAPELM